jgi:hypothetical protein
MIAGRTDGRSIAWRDTGGHESLIDASQFAATIEKRQGLNVAVPQEIASRMGYIDADPPAKAGRVRRPYRLRTILIAIAGECVLKCAGNERTATCRLRISACRGVTAHQTRPSRIVLSTRY